MKIAFTKYQGSGNDFILIDNRHADEPLVTPATAARMCDRHFGIGADGVIFALPGRGDTDYTMRIFNADGSEPEMCGNGIRCLARFVARLERVGETERTYRVRTLAGTMSPRLANNGQVTVDMGVPRLLAAETPTTLATADQKVIDLPLDVRGKIWYVTCVSMGNPHCVTFVEDVDAIPLETLGVEFELNPVFPRRTNVEFIRAIRPDLLKMRVWERGAGITLACGTGACASVVAGVLTGRCDRSCTVELPGGDLQIHWSPADGHVYMTGPATEVFSGEYGF
jgi:diaminopimelate epimerase